MPSKRAFHAFVELLYWVPRVARCDSYMNLLHEDWKLFPIDWIAPGPAILPRMDFPNTRRATPRRLTAARRAFVP